MTDSAQRLGAYTIEREIGRGGMGVVHLARDGRLDRRVAIKMLPDEFAHDPVRLARFGAPHLLFTLTQPFISLDHTADMRRFLTARQVNERAPSTISVVLNWRGALASR